MSYYVPPQSWKPDGPPPRPPELTCPACRQPAWVLRELVRDGDRVLRGCPACADALEARARREQAMRQAGMWW